MTDIAALPGLAYARPAGSDINQHPLVVAARQHIAGLAAKGLLTEDHQLTCAMIEHLAGLAASSKAYAAAQVAKELREAMASLPSEETADAWAALRDWLSAEQGAEHPEDFSS